MAAQKQFTTSAGSHLQNREIFYGPGSHTWPVPSGTTEVHVHVWGGGGSGYYSSYAGVGGGGGGYARAPYTVTDADTLSITVGAAGGTSSVTIPTQGPTSPVSATGGNTSSSTSSGGTGGTGTATLHSSFPHYYCMNADGGAGGAPCGPSYSSNMGSGGAAGSPLGIGGSGGWGCNNFGGGIGQAPGFNRHSQCYLYCTGGAGSPVYGQTGPIITCHGGNYLTGRKSGCNYNPDAYSNYNPSSGPMGDAGTISVGSVGCSSFIENVKTCWFCWNPPSYVLSTCPGGITRLYTAPDANTSRGDDWFWVEDMAGSGAFCYTTPAGQGEDRKSGAGAGGGRDAQAGILGGGSQQSAPSAVYLCPTSAGYGGGGGSNGQSANPTLGPHTGGAGLVILYW